MNIALPYPKTYNIMKKIKFQLALIAISLLMGALTASAQDSTYSSSTTMSSNSSSKQDSTPDASNSTGMIVGGISVVVLGIVIALMYINRRKTIGGMQSQDKPSPKPVTTQSINNPGTGV